ncbi:glycoside hydrolase family 9 protein [Robertkochia aurantiaca]|uniref:glycoside hydrolase family 9 protein n=1 Tax=Robertkochia aurantiaca TaxID=2873700 RepID=UPI001CCF9775|nr:glycoside hydrolase family 9 protein [Robertkochia sp. 3YJGBD-33]
MNRSLQFFIFFFLLINLCTAQTESAIRVNQVGYRPHDIKSALLIASATFDKDSLGLYDQLTDALIRKIAVSDAPEAYYELESVYQADFSDFKEPGAYYLGAGSLRSPAFYISENVYAGTADYLLHYLRSRRCGYNPYFKKSCHVDDGIIIYHPDREGEKIDVSGGWHDASDYLQYVTTSANAVFQLLFAYEQNPHAFDDRYQASGLPGANGIPDILDEAKWGLDWLVKMNPEPGLMFHQIADDRDHRSFDLPYKDTLDYGYGKGKERPVYYVTGKPQGLMEYQNNSNGKANIAGKFASSFALGSELLKPFYPEFSQLLIEKARSAYVTGKEYPGVCQTAPCRAPYFYEEENWEDDMELAAMQLYQRTKEVNYLSDALKFAAQEPVTPWMKQDSVRHYQYYPFVNLGHYYMSSAGAKDEGLKYYRQGIDHYKKRSSKNIFLNGLPFVWCSNNLAAAMLTQLSLSARLQPETSSVETESALRDWLFGRNPWGTSMVVGLPQHGDYPEDTHAAISHYTDEEPWGGLVDGPVYGSIFKSLKGVKLAEEDEYAAFQTSRVVYHDDWADYSTNEPTMDGTASLTYYLSSLVPENRTDNNTYYKDALIRGDSTKKQIALIFTGHDRAEGFDKVNKALKKHNVKASFFLTGDFYRNPKFKNIISTLIDEDHYLGAHSDKHLLYCSWEDRDSLLVDKALFRKDLKANYAAMASHGINKSDAFFYLPPYEWYNEKISLWTRENGLRLINHSPGTNSNQDWTTPDLGDRYYSNERLWKGITGYETEKGLEGFHLLLHFGTDEKRQEKFYDRLDQLIEELKKRGYSFVRIDQMHEKNLQPVFVPGGDDL